VTALEHLGVTPDGTGWRVSAPESLHGAYGGAFGGFLAAITVAVAREAAPGRVPFALDCQFVRGLRGAQAPARADVVRRGRSMTVVSVTITEDDDVATRATVLLAEPSSLDDWHVADRGAAPAGTAEAKPWRHPPGRRVGIIDTLAPRANREPDGGIATTINTPWPEPDCDAGAEVACMAADLATGPPVEASFDGTWRPHPNPDLSLRFLPRPVTAAEVTGVGTLDGTVAGVAMMSLAVWAGGQRLAVGISTALVSPPPQRDRAPGGQGP
jgi:hypothetical protein